MEPLKAKKLIPSGARRRVVPSAWSAGAVLVAGLALSGCSTGVPGQPATPTATSSAPSASSKPEPVGYQPATPTSPAKNVPVPKKPIGIDVNWRLFLAYWLQTREYLWETGDSDLYRLFTNGSGCVI